MKENPTDEQLSQWVERCQEGDLTAFNHLVRANQAWLRGWLRGQLRDWTAADDIAQDTFVTAFKKIKHYRGDGSFAAWVRSIAHNHFRNYIRKHREEYIGGNDELQFLLSTEDQDHHEPNATILALQDCMTRMKAPDTALIKERYLKGKTVREIAKETNAGYSSMTMKLHRIRKSLATCIESKLTQEQA